MGKLFELLSSGVGLVAEGVASSTHKSESYGSNNSRKPWDDRRYSRPPYYETDKRPQQLEAESVQDNRSQYQRPDYNQDTYNQYLRSDYRQDDHDQSRGSDYWEDERSSQTYPVPISTRQFQPPRSSQTTVIIPQRRPGTKDRGWAIAYTPVLLRFDIDRDAFINFLWSFNESCKASPALDAVNLAAFGVGFAPGIAPMVISTVVPMVVTAAKTTQTNTQSSKFLAKANAELFEPRGLVAVITTFKTEEQSAVVSVDVESPNQFRQTRPTQENLEENQYNAECMLQAAAPLDYVTDEEMAERYQNQFRKGTHFVADFMDRRTQASMSTKYSGVQGSYGPRPQFRTPWGDPNSAANNGGLIGLVSGGYISRPRKDKDDDKDEKKRRKEEKKKAEGPGLIGSARGAIMGQTNPKDQSGGLIKGLKSKAEPSHDLLYLMIIAKH